MIVDNCLAQPKAEKLLNMTVKFIPPSATSFSQLLDQALSKMSRHCTESI
jgi:hypothetical protein